MPVYISPPSLVFEIVKLRGFALERSSYDVEKWFR